MKPLLIIGCGGHARSIIDIVEESGLWEIFGLIGKQKELGKDINGYKVIGTDEDLNLLRQKCSDAFVGVGKIGSSSTRVQLTQRLEKLNFNLPTLISNFSKVSRHSKIGPGTSIGHGVVVNANSSIGKHCIINSQSLIEHNAIIEDYCHISTGALINGNTTVGENSFIGSGAVLREGIILPANTTISAGKRVMGWPIKTN